jgi:isoleucyl-tRNA synthetase
VKELGSPCDMYLEGSDQHRGWFQSSLLTSVGTRGRTPYNSVLTHGFVVDGKGEKMAKSKGNVISPEEVIKQYGAEILRLWVVSENYQEDMRISPDILKRLSEAYRKIRNTCRFILGNLYDFNPTTDTALYTELEEIDQWALYRLNQLVRRVLKAYEVYEFHTIYHSITNFCINDMSAVYLDILKDRLYCSAPLAPIRKTAQTALYWILGSLVELLAPVLSFTSEEAWQHIPERKKESVHLATFPSDNSEFDNRDIAKKWDLLLKTRNRVLKHLEDARIKKEIGNSLEAAVRLEAPQKLYDFLQLYRQELADIYIVSQVKLEVKASKDDFPLENLIEDIEITVSRAKGKKCQRCWKNYVVKEVTREPNICDRCATVLKTNNADT